jgi:xylan 1,4-beta-xylosidase
MKKQYFIILSSVLMFLPHHGSGQQSQISLNAFTIDVDINRSIGEMYPMWAYWGYDEPNYTYMADGRKLIAELERLSPVPVYYRAHSMLCTDEGPRAALKWGSTNAYTEDEQGNPVYDWTIVDKIVDTYIEHGGKPMMETGFMPKALSSNPEPYRHHWRPGDVYSNIFLGWAYPPEDYEKWSELIYQWVRHSVERYGAEEVSTWWWDVWNEPDIPYWRGTMEEYFKLYDYTAKGIKRALPSARVGGPTTTNPGLGDDHSGQFLREFLEHCRSGTNYATGKKGTPLDFVSFHAKGSPRAVDDGHHVQMNMGRQLEAIDAGFQIVASFPEFKDTPIIIGESDPEGCAACSFASGYTHNGYRNGTMYASYTASSFARKYDLADKHGVNFEGAVSWSFEFEDQPWFDGFRTMATNGVDKPVLNVFRMFGMMGGDRVAVSQEDPITADEIIKDMVRGERPDVHALASRQGDEVMVMVWNYHDDDLPAPDADVLVNITGIPAGRALIRHYRIDDQHSNAYTVWQNMGAPQQVTRDQYKKLEASGQLEMLTSPKWIDVSNGKAPVRFSLPRQGVSLLQVTW